MSLNAVFLVSNLFAPHMGQTLASTMTGTVAKDRPVDYTFWLLFFKVYVCVYFVNG